MLIFILSKIKKEGEWMKAWAKDRDYNPIRSL
jgi:hypothetical protein